jgi:poly-gamma-glutamate synthesis protein (capsule biosynthesis protein)
VGLLETVAALDRAGIAHAGAGADLAAARAPAIVEAAGFRVAVVAFADHPAAWAATPTAPGINYLPISTAPPATAVVAESVAAARAAADLVVVSLHWGPNMRARPTPDFRAFARRAIEAGADVFFGHSAHVVQGVELWRGRPILYDAGDFVDDYAVDPELRNDRSALFLLRVTPTAVERLELLPVRIDHCQVNRARGPDRDWFARRVVALSAEFGTEILDDGERLRVRLPVHEGSTSP